MAKYLSIDLNIFQILILVMIIIMIKKKQTYKSYSSRLFLALCWSTVIILSLDAVFWVLNGKSFLLVYISTVAYFLAEPVPLIIWLCYLDYHLFNSVERLRKRWYYTQPFIFVALLMLINGFSDFIFTIDKSSRYQRGPGVSLILAMNFGIILSMLVLAIKERKKLEKKTFTVIVMFGTIPIMGGILQMLTYGASILWNSVALSVVFIYIFLETQKEIRDYLTGLLNRQQIDDLIISRMTDYVKKGGFSLIMLDMDAFKSINDTFGHKEGDRALIRLAEILHDSVKGIDRVARFGGDEFIILLEEERTGKIREVIDRIQDSLTRENNANGRPYKLSVSTGFTIYSPVEHKNFQELMNDADQKMYAEKLKKSIPGKKKQQSLR